MTRCDQVASHGWPTCVCLGFIVLGAMKLKIMIVHAFVAAREGPLFADSPGVLDPS